MSEDAATSGDAEEVTLELDDSGTLRVLVGGTRHQASMEPPDLVQLALAILNGHLVKLILDQNRLDARDFDLSVLGTE